MELLMMQLLYLTLTNPMQIAKWPHVPCNVPTNPSFSNLPLISLNPRLFWCRFRQTFVNLTSLGLGYVKAIHCFSHIPTITPINPMWTCKLLQHGRSFTPLPRSLLPLLLLLLCTWVFLIVVNNMMSILLFILSLFILEVWRF